MALPLRNTEHYRYHLHYHTLPLPYTDTHTTTLTTTTSLHFQVVPGDNATLTIELICPVPMADGLRFALREGGKTVGAGVVSKVIL